MYILFALLLPMFSMYPATLGMRGRVNISQRGHRGVYTERELLR